MQDLQEVTHDLHYENYRASRLGDEPEASAMPKAMPPSAKTSSKRGGQGEAEKDRILQEKELELQKMQEMIAMMQAQLQAQQTQQPAPKESKECGFYSFLSSEVYTWNKKWKTTRPSQSVPLTKSDRRRRHYIPLFIFSFFSRKKQKWLHTFC